MVSLGCVVSFVCLFCNLYYFLFRSFYVLRVFSSDFYLVEFILVGGFCNVYFHFVVRGDLVYRFSSISDIQLLLDIRAQLSFR